MSKRYFFKAKPIMTLALIVVFITYYIENTGLKHISASKLLFIPGIFILAFFIDLVLIKRGKRKGE